MNEKFMYRLIDFRIVNDMSQGELSKLAKVHVQTIIDIEKGRKEAPRMVKRRLELAMEDIENEHKKAVN